MPIIFHHPLQIGFLAMPSTFMQPKCVCVGEFKACKINVSICSDSHPKAKLSTSKQKQTQKELFSLISFQKMSNRPTKHK